MLFDGWKKCDIAWLKAATKQLEKLPKADRLKVIAQTNNVTIHPESLDLKKLSGYQDLYRLRVGNYRIVFKINKTKKLIIVAYIAHRKEVYSSLKKPIFH